MARIKTGERVVVKFGVNGGRAGTVKSASYRGFSVLLDGRTKSTLFSPGDLIKERVYVPDGLVSSDSD